MKNILSLLIIFFSVNSYAQLVFNNGGFMKLNGGSSGTPIYLVLGGTAIPATPITVNTSGGIVSENEFNKLRYQLGAGTTAINVPFLRGTSTSNTVGIALSAISGGSAGGYIDFSNKSAGTIGVATNAGWDNGTYMPSTVTHMSQYTAPGTNGSDWVIDRFWIVDASSYATKPSATFTFTFLDDEFAANGGNDALFTKSRLQAQRFNTASLIWGDFIGGTQSGQTVQVSVSAANFAFKNWTLSDNSNPLPIELTKANVKCVEQGTLITWSTASETNNAYFTVEKSEDGIQFSGIATLQGAGNSNNILNYSYHDDTNSPGTLYYRIKQTDFDGTFKYSEVFSINCGGNSGFEFNAASANADGQLTLFTSSSQDEIRNIRIVNTLGQLIYENKKPFNAGSGQLNINTANLAAGVYYISLFNEKSNLVKKVYVN